MDPVHVPSLNPIEIIEEYIYLKNALSGLNVEEFLQDLKQANSIIWLEEWRQKNLDTHRKKILLEMPYYKTLLKNSLVVQRILDYII